MKICLGAIHSRSGFRFHLGQPAHRVVGVSPRPNGRAAVVGRAGLVAHQHGSISIDAGDPESPGHGRPEAIVNFAAQSEVAPSWDHPEHWYETNCGWRGSSTTCVAKAGVTCISSPEVYGNCQGTVAEDAPLNPSTPYAASRRLPTCC